MTPEQQRIAIAKACGLVLAKESGIPKHKLDFLDGHSSRLQHVLNGWVATHSNNPDGVWVRGGCSQAVTDKRIAEKWASDPHSTMPLVVAVKMLQDVPDYPNDLNACHEMERVAFFANGTPASRWQSYDNELHRICGGFGRAHATASQRCEAFLRTLNLWQE